MTSRKTSEIYDTACHVLDHDTVVVQGARFVRERTCENVVSVRGSYCHHFTCSECGAYVYDSEMYFVGIAHGEDGEAELPWSYCPNCGARVV